MRYAFLFVALCFFQSMLSAQTCNCAEQFEFLTQKMAANYAGYQDKVNPATQAAFDAHTARYRALTAPVMVDTTCARLLHEWTLFFKDRHVQLNYNPAQENPEQVRQRFSAWEKIALDEAAARSLIDRPGGNPLEGIWEMQGGNYRVALVPAPTTSRDLAAVVLRADSVYWVPGQVKFELKKEGEGYAGNFYMRDHSLKTSAAVFEDNQLKFNGLSTWQRVYPGSGKLPATAARQIFTLKQLDSTTLLITVPTMYESVRLQLDSLVKANQKLLASTPNLIIDCRNNGGGSDITYYPLKPFLYTQPVTGYNMQLWATPDNADKFSAMATNPDLPRDWQRHGKRMARKMRRHYGQFIGKSTTYKERMKRVLPYPKHVAVLINGGCGSSCEQFVLFAQQSAKTTLIGQNTAGVLDYGNLHFLTFPDQRFEIGYPTSRSRRVAAGKGIDNIGIPPAVRLEEKDGDWVEFARQYLHQKGG